MSTPCEHPTMYVDCRAAANSGFVRPSPEERTLAMSKTGRLARGAYLAKEDAVHDDQTFPGPLVLPGDHLAEHPREQGQSLRDWFALEATQKRRPTISRKKKLYVYGPPSMSRLSEDMRSWTNLVLPQGFAPGPERWTYKQQMYKQLIVYLRAFFTTMYVTQYPGNTHFLPIQGRKRVHFADAPQISVIGFRIRDGGETFEIRHRPSPDGLSRMQLNVFDLRTALIRIKAPAAHSVVMVVNHDIYEEGDGAYLTERLWASDGIVIVSTFRYNPSLDGLAGVDRLHRWPASHCQAYVDERCQGPNENKDSTTRNRLPFKAFGKPPGDSALGLAIQAAN